MWSLGKVIAGSLRKSLYTCISIRIYDYIYVMVFLRILLKYLVSTSAPSGPEIQFEALSW